MLWRFNSSFTIKLLEVFKPLNTIKSKIKLFFLLYISGN